MKDADFRAFIAGERSKLINYVRSLLTETADMDAEDVVHDVLVKMLERADSLAPVENLAAYLYRSLRNRVVDSVRTRKPTLSLDSEAEGDARLMEVLHDIKPNALEMLQTREGKEKLFEALDTLSEMERRVVIAHEFEGTPFKQMSRQWEIPQNTLLSHKSRAMSKLKRHFLES